MGFFVAMVFIVVPLLIWQIVNPRSMWEATQSWRFRDPAANEPSDAAFAFSRAGAVVALGAFGFLIFSLLGVDDEADRSADSTPLSTYTPEADPTVGFTDTDLGPGTIVGYRYPSELAISFVVLEGGNATLGSCSTDVGVYEHTNAIIVQVVRSYREFDIDSGRDPSAMCTAESPREVTETLDRPIGNRPILTAAPIVDAASVGLRPGPRVRPKPPREIPNPGVVQPQRPVRIDPDWKRVPLLAAE